MEPYTIHRVQILPAPPEEVFAFFKDPANLARITPPELGFRILTPPPLVMHEGAVIDYTIRVFGLRLRWTTVITEYEPPHRFVDLQLKGPYAYWHHTHAFRAVKEGTEMTDTVRYVLRGGPLGPTVNALVVKRKLEKIFTHRALVIASMFHPLEPAAAHAAEAPKKSVKKRTVPYRIRKKAARKR